MSLSLPCRCRFIDFAAAWMAIVVRDSVTLAILIAWVLHDNHGGAHLNDAYVGMLECWCCSQKPGDSYQMFPPPTERLACETTSVGGLDSMRIRCTLDLSGFMWTLTNRIECAFDSLRGVHVNVLVIIIIVIINIVSLLSWSYPYNCIIIIIKSG